MDASAIISPSFFEWVREMTNSYLYVTRHRVQHKEYEEMKNEEKPKLYIITGHRSTGKTSHIASLLPDHPFVPDVYELNKKIRDKGNQIKYGGSLYDHSLQTYQQLHALNEYAGKQAAARQNLYIEVDSSNEFNMNTFNFRLKDQYTPHIIFLLCNNLDESIKRTQANLTTIIPANTSRALELDYKATNRYVNNCEYRFLGNLEIFSTTDHGPKQLLSMKDGNILSASSEILTKPWLYLESIGLRTDIKNFLNQQQQAQKQVEAPRQEREKSVRRRLRF